MTFALGERLPRLFNEIAGAPATAISPRVREAIRRYEATSEVLIGWTQLAGVCLFLGLYAVSYSAFDVHSAIEPAPIALLLYGGFTVWRLRLSSLGRLGAGLVYASALLDVSVLMLMISLFPMQYDEPPALYLKAPTLCYVFILIALRSLRFDPLLVIATGAAAAAGWALLSLNASLSGAPVTSDYRVYMTSLSLLPGAELEKIAAIVGATAVIALSVVRQQRLLHRTG